MTVVLFDVPKHATFSDCEFLEGTKGVLCISVSSKPCSEPSAGWILKCVLDKVGIILYYYFLYLYYYFY